MKELTPFARYILALLALAILLIQACSPAETKDCGGACADNEECINNQFCLPKCETSQSRCGTECKDLKIDTKHCGKCDNACKDGQACKDGKCDTGPACKDGETDCNGQCVDTTSDAKHCGKCGVKCPAGEACQSGACVFSCPDNQEPCDGLCINTKANREHCGACNNKCDNDKVCNQGKCELNCSKGFEVCGGGCINTQKDASHCGDCETSCQGTERCNKGKCEPVCPKDFALCEGACANIQTSTSHCGACGNQCKDGEFCVNGTCGVNCSAGLTECSGACVNTDSDNKHCGACGTACKDRTVCQSGKCTNFCQKGFTDCSGSCADTSADAANCGTCGTTCAANEICLRGNCSQTCIAGRISCNGFCADFTKDSDNCGYCGNKCAAGKVCHNRKCEDCLDCPSESHRAGAIGKETLYGMIMDKQGNAYITGSFDQIATFGKIRLKSTKVSGYVAKMDAKGNWLWVAKWDSTSNTRGNSVAIDSKGNILVAGTFRGTTTFGNSHITSKGGDDMFIAKWDKDGKWIWTKTYGGSQTDSANSITINSKDEAYITGTFNHRVTFGTRRLSSKGGADLIILKLSSSAQLLRVDRYGENGEQVGVQLAMDKNDHYYLTGSYRGQLKFGAIALPNSPTRSAFVARFDNQGNAVFATSFASTSDVYGHAIDVDGSGNTTIAGHFTGTMTANGKTYTASDSDGFVAQFDSAGKWRWINVLTGSGSAVINGVNIDSQGRVFVVGTASGDNRVGAKPIQSKVDSGFLGQLTKAGLWEGLATATSTSLTELHAIAIDSKDDIYVAGFFDRIAKLGSTEIVSRGQTDALVARYTKPTLLCDSQANICNNVCVDRQSDPKNCGACGTTCRNTESCIAGKCTCPSGQSYCGGKCIDTINDTNNCGGCGTTCKTGEVCQLGVCSKCTNCVAWLSQGADGSDGKGQVLGLDVDRAGNTYVVGEFYHQIAFGNTKLIDTFKHIAVDTTDIFVAKANAQGKWLWARSYGSSNLFRDTKAKDIKVDSNGNVYITGHFRDLTFKGQVFPSISEDRLYVAKFDTDGKEQWLRTATAQNNPNEGHGLAIDAANNVYVVGEFASSATFGTKVLNSKGGNDCFIAKLNGNGQWQWATQLGGIGSDVGHAVAVDSTGNVYLTGQYTLSLTFGNSSISTGKLLIYIERAFIAKVDKNGTPQWAITDRNSDNTDTDGRGIITDKAGNVYVTGSFQKTSFFGTMLVKSKGSTDGYIVKVDPTGKYIWAKNYGGSSAELSHRIAIDSKGYLVTIGMSASSSYQIGTVSLKNKGQDCLLAKWNDKGKLIGAMNGGGSEIEHCYALAIDSTDLPHFGGYTHSNTITFGTSSFKRLTTGSRNDAPFVAKIENTDLCPPENTLCSGVCTNPQLDSQNCGSCGTKCTGTQTCQAGICR